MTAIIQKGYAFIFLSAVYEWLLATTFDQTGTSGDKVQFLAANSTVNDASGQ